jgi:hypothetical protein
MVVLDIDSLLLVGLDALAQRSSRPKMQVPKMQVRGSVADT